MHSLQILSLAHYKTVAIQLSHTARLLQVSLPLRRTMLSVNSGRSWRAHFFEASHSLRTLRDWDRRAREHRALLSVGSPGQMGQRPRTHWTGASKRADGKLATTEQTHRQTRMRCDRVGLPLFCGHYQWLPAEK